MPIALTESYYLTLRWRDFQAVIKSHEEQIERDHLAFLRKIPEFTHLTKNVLGRLSRDFKHIIAVKGQVLYTEGRPANYLFFVKTG